MKRYLKRIKNNVIENVKRARSYYFDNYLFIHINKTGGSSIKKALSLPFEHKTVQEKIEELGCKKWNKLFKFTVIRNPWDKVVSHYHYRYQTNQTKLKSNGIQFNDWVKLTYGNRDSFYYDNPKMFMPQINWLTNRKSDILVDYICRFENIDNDFKTVCNIIGKQKNLPHLKKTIHKNYQEYYDCKAKEIISQWFEMDIEIFGYKF